MEIKNGKAIDMLHTIKTKIEEAINEEIKKEFDTKLKQLTTEMESKRNKIVAGVLLHIIQMFDIQNYQDRIIFTIRKYK